MDEATLSYLVGIIVGCALYATARSIFFAHSQRKRNKKIDKIDENYRRTIAFDQNRDYKNQGNNS